MSRRHTFLIVVLLGAATVAGLLAMTRTAALGSPAGTSSGPDDAISFRLRKLDRLEASLQQRLAAQAPAPVRGSSSSLPSIANATPPYGDEYEHEDTGDHEEDGGFDDEDRDD